VRKLGNFFFRFFGFSGKKGEKTPFFELSASEKCAKFPEKVCFLTFFLKKKTTFFEVSYSQPGRGTIYLA
jgi:hypothetical protein